MRFFFFVFFSCWWWSARILSPANDYDEEKIGDEEERERRSDFNRVSPDGRGTGVVPEIRYPHSLFPCCCKNIHTHWTVDWRAKFLRKRRMARDLKMMVRWWDVVQDLEVTGEEGNQMLMCFTWWSCDFLLFFSLSLSAFAFFASLLLLLIMRLLFLLPLFFQFRTLCTSKAGAGRQLFSWSLITWAEEMRDTVSHSVFPLLSSIYTHRMYRYPVVTSYLMHMCSPPVINTVSVFFIILAIAANSANDMEEETEREVCCVCFLSPPPVSRSMIRRSICYDDLRSHRNRVSLPNLLVSLWCQVLCHGFFSLSMHVAALDHILWASACRRLVSAYACYPHIYA